MYLDAAAEGVNHVWFVFGLRLFDRGKFQTLAVSELVKKAPTFGGGAKSKSKFDASASRVFEGALRSSDAEIFVISQCEFETLVHERSGLIVP